MQVARRFTSMMVDSEVSVLRRLHGMLENDVVDTRDAFSDLMKAAFEHGRLDARGLSDDLGYSFTTVYRWIEGRNAPHPSLWPCIILWIMKAIDAKIAGYHCDTSERMQA